jgi:hypothetical protein
VNHPILVDTEFMNFNNHVMNIIDKQAPLKKKLVKGKFTPWMTREIVDSMKIRNKSHKKALLTRKIEDWSVYRRERNKTTRKINQGKKVYFKEKFQKSTESTSLWNTVDELTNFRVKVRNPICVHEDTNNSLISDESLIGNILANEFIVHKENEITDVNLVEQINDYEATYDYSNSDQCDKTPIIYPTDVLDSIKSMKNKYSGNTQYPSIMVIKSCLSPFSATLCVFFSFFLKYNIIPQCFKAANVIPLYKGKGSRRQAKSYRPIALLNIYSKIFESFLFSRLNVRIEAQLISEQHGFRKHRSCSTALRIFTNYLYSAIDKRKGKAVAIFVDLKNGFDSVDQTLLINKLMYAYKVEPWYVKILKEIFRNRVFKIDGNNHY